MTFYTSHLAKARAEARRRIDNPLTSPEHRDVCAALLRDARSVAVIGRVK